MAAIFATTFAAPKAHAQNNAGAYRYVVLEDPLAQQYNSSNYFPIYSEDLSYTNLRVFTVNGQDGLRGPSTVSTAFRQGVGPYYYSSDYINGYDPYLSASSANYVRLDRAGNALGINRRYGKIIRTPNSSSSIQVLPSPPGTIPLPDGSQHWPFLALSAGRPLSTSEYTFAVQTSNGLYQYSYSTGQYYLVDASPNAEAFSVADRGFIAGQDETMQAVVWFYGNKWSFNRPAETSKAISVNEFGTTVGFDNNFRADASASDGLSAWLGKYGTTASVQIPGMSFPVAINNSGQVVGVRTYPTTYSDRTVPPLPSEGVLYEQLTGKTVLLKSLFTPGNAMTSVIPTAINDHGVIAFYAVRNGQPVSGELLPENRIDTWWVPDNYAIGNNTAYGFQEPFQLHASYQDTSNSVPDQYLDGFWMVDADFSNLHSMQDQYTGSGVPFKQDNVDTSGWNWRAAGNTMYPDDTYYVTYVLKDKSGNLLNEDTHRIYVKH